MVEGVTLHNDDRTPKPWRRAGRFTQVGPPHQSLANYQALFFRTRRHHPNACGKRVISRAHAKRRDKDASLSFLTGFDYLAAVDDFSRVGALRLQDEDGDFLRGAGPYRAPPFVELERLYAASRTVEEGNESLEELAYLQGRGTSLGGLRPKCTILDEDGRLAIGKFPSIEDDRSVPRGEVLALALSRRAGIHTSEARIVMIDSTAVAVIRRFDRVGDGARIPYLSGGSLLQASRHEDRSYTEMVDMLRATPAAGVDENRRLERMAAAQGHALAIGSALRARHPIQPIIGARRLRAHARCFGQSRALHQPFTACNRTTISPYASPRIRSSNEVGVPNQALFSQKSAPARGQPLPARARCHCDQRHSGACRRQALRHHAVRRPGAADNDVVHHACFSSVRLSAARRCSRIKYF